MLALLASGHLRPNEYKFSQRYLFTRMKERGKEGRKEEKGEKGKGREGAMRTGLEVKGRDGWIGVVERGLGGGGGGGK